MSTCAVRGAQAPTPNLQHTYYTPTSIMCGAYAPRMRDLRVECWECELNENKFYFGGKHTRIYQFMLKIFQYSQHISLRYAQVMRTQSACIRWPNVGPTKLTLLAQRCKPTLALGISANRAYVAPSCWLYVGPTVGPIAGLHWPNVGPTCRHIKGPMMIC